MSIRTRDLMPREYQRLRGQKLVSAEMPVEVHAQLAQLAEREDLSVSHLIRRAVRQYLLAVDAAGRPE